MVKFFEKIYNKLVNTSSFLLAILIHLKKIVTNFLSENFISYKKIESLHQKFQIDTDKKFETMVNLLKTSTSFISENIYEKYIGLHEKCIILEEKLQILISFSQTQNASISTQFSNICYGLEKINDNFQAILSNINTSINLNQNNAKNLEFKIQEKLSNIEFEEFIKNFEKNNILISSNLSNISITLQEYFNSFQSYITENKKYFDAFKEEIKRKKVLILIDWPNFFKTWKNLSQKFLNFYDLYSYLVSNYSPSTIETMVFIPDTWNNRDEILLKKAGFNVQKTVGDVDLDMHQEGKKLVKELLNTCNLNKVIICAGDNSYMGLALEIKSFGIPVQILFWDKNLVGHDLSRVVNVIEEIDINYQESVDTQLAG